MEKAVVSEVLQDMIAKGLVEKIMENGEAKYKLTSLGRSIGEQVESIMFASLDIQKGYHVMHKQTKRVGRVHSFDSSQSIVTVKWTDSDVISSHETSELNFSLFCNRKHSMYDLFCFLHPNHNGWCGCN